MAPAALKLAGLPIHTGAVVLAVTLGKALMLTAEVICFEQPLASVPVTLYVVAVVNVGVVILAVVAPVLHK